MRWKSDGKKRKRDVCIMYVGAGRAGRQGWRDTQVEAGARAFVQVCTVRIWRYRIKEIQIIKKRYRRIEPWIRYI